MRQKSQKPIDIKIDGLQFSYAKQKNIINIPELTFKAGEHAFIYGPSGSGKSTFLNLLCGILRPKTGTIYYNDIAINQLSSSQCDRFRAQHIGVIFQQFNLIPYLNILENIQLASYFSKDQIKDKQEGILHIFNRLSLPIPILTQRADTLSVGQQQRVAIARALGNQPSILIADEPTSALDTDSRDDFISLLFECADNFNTTLLFVSHDQSLAKKFDVKLELPAINQAHASLTGGL